MRCTPSSAHVDDPTSPSSCEGAPTCWYAVHCKPHFEFEVASYLKGAALETYLPVFDELHRWSDRNKVVHVPVFPGYVLVRFADVPGSRTIILRNSGVLRILGHGKFIEPVPEEQIQAVRRLLAGPGPCEAHPLIQEGQPVRVKRGALKGLEGLLARIKNSTRLVVSMELLGRSVSAEIGAEDVEAIALS